MLQSSPEAQAVTGTSPEIVPEFGFVPLPYSPFSSLSLVSPSLINQLPQNNLRVYV